MTPTDRSIPVGFASDLVKYLDKTYAPLIVRVILIPESGRPLDMMPQLELGWTGPSSLLAPPTYDVLRLGPSRVGL